MKNKFKQTETRGERTHSTSLRVRRTIGEIPEGWGVGKVGDLVNVRSGYAIKSSDFCKSGVGVIKIKNIDSERIDLFDTDKVTPKFFETLPDEYKVSYGDVLIAMTGATIGKTGKIRSTKERYALNQRVARFVSNDQWNLEYVFQYTLSREFINSIHNLATGAAQQNISADNIASIPMFIPPKEERLRIAKILSSLDEKIELNHQMNKTLESIAQAIFKRWFVDFEFPGYEKTKIVDGLPEGWQVKEIKDCGEVICGKTPPTKDKENYGSDIFFITIPDMRGQVFVIKTERKLSKQGVDLQKNKNLPPLSICVSCIATPGLVSLTSVISQTNQQINSIVCEKDISPYFMYYAMVAKSEEIKSMGLGGTATLNLNTGNFAKINVLIPDDGVMNQFHNELAPLLENVLANLRENANLCDIRDSLLPRLMSGKLRINS